MTATDVGGTTKIPIGSLRLKALRDGMEDYEYLHQLDQLCPPEAKKKVEELFGTHVVTRSANKSVSLLYQVRNQIADRIATLRSNPGLCSGTGGGTCTCTGTGTKCFLSSGGWYYAGQYCNSAGDCVSNPCVVDP